MRPRRVVLGAPARSHAPVPIAWSLGVGAAFGALYLALAPPVVGGKDASELSLALAVGGAPHPTGYPLYTLVGYVVVTLARALGMPWAYAANAWSAVGAAVAVGLLHALAARIVPPGVGLGRGARWLLAVIAIVPLAVNPVWLLDAMMAEVYSWHLAWVCGAGLFALAWLRGLGGAGRFDAGGMSAAGPQRAALGWGFLCGVGLAHHVTSVLVILPLSAMLVVALRRARRWRMSLALAAAAAALMPLASYGFIAWRAFHPASYQWGQLEPSLGGVLEHVTGGTYRDLLGGFAPSAVQRDLFRSCIYPVLFPALAALIVAALRAPAGPDRLALAGLTAAAAFQTAYGFSYRVSDPSSYFQPNMAIALLAVARLGAGLMRRPLVFRVATGLALVGLVALAVPWIGLGFAVRAGTITIERQVRERWRALPDRPAIVLWRHDMLPALKGWQLLDGEKRALYIEDPYALTWTVPRRVFAARFGFDPVAGLQPLTGTKLVQIPDHINAQTALPVFLFDPGPVALAPLAKPAAADTVGRAR